MTDHLVFKKFLARSFFSHLVSNKTLPGSFSNSNMHADHVDFNAFLASTFLNVSKHVSHLFSFGIKWLSLMQTRLFIYTVPEKKQPTQSFIQKVCSETFHGCLGRFLIQKIFKAQIFHAIFSIFLISYFLEQLHYCQKMIENPAKVLHYNYFIHSIFYK